MTPAIYTATARMAGEGLDILGDSDLLLRYRQALRLKCGRAYAEEAELWITRSGFRLQLPGDRPIHVTRAALVRRIASISKTEASIYAGIVSA